MSPAEADWFVEKYLTNTGIDYKTVKLQLREELERLAQQYRDNAQRIPTMREFIEEITKSVAEIATARDRFLPQQWPVAYLLGKRLPGGKYKYLPGNKRAAEIYNLLTTVVADLQEEMKRMRHGSELDTLRYEGARDNASDLALRNYLLAIAELWHGIAGATAPLVRNRFVYATAAPMVERLEKERAKRLGKDPKPFTTKTVSYYLSSNKKTKTTS